MKILNKSESFEKQCDEVDKMLSSFLKLNSISSTVATAVFCKRLGELLKKHNRDAQLKATLLFAIQHWSEKEE